MITEDYVSFETAKLLKKVGYPMEKVIVQDDSNRPILYNLQYDNPYFQDCDAWYCPSSSQAAKWIREEKDLVIKIDLECTEYVVTLVQTNAPFHKYCGADEFEYKSDNYNDVFEHGIIECCRLIKKGGKKEEEK